LDSDPTAAASDPSAAATGEETVVLSREDSFLSESADTLGAVSTGLPGELTLTTGTSEDFFSSPAAEGVKAGSDGEASGVASLSTGLHSLGSSSFTDSAFSTAAGTVPLDSST